MPSVPDRACPRWHRIRSAIGATVRHISPALDIDPDLHADRIWLATRPRPPRVREDVTRRAQTGEKTR